METGDHTSFVNELVEDALQRQVDTVLTTGITGRGMPHPIRALIDINNSYFRKLRDLNYATAKEIPSDAGDGKGWLSGNSPGLQWGCKTLARRPSRTRALRARSNVSFAASFRPAVRWCRSWQSSRLTFPERNSRT
jgi:hypothetical protein